MKYYNYSVKDLLLKKFGEEPLLKMREKHNGAVFDDYSNNNESAEALMWQGVDQSALGHFLENIFYDNAQIEDDYIVYFGHDTEATYAIVTFAHDAQHKLEDLPYEYAYEVCHKYEGSYDHVWLLQQTSMHCYYLRNGYYTGSGYLSMPKKINGEYVLTDVLEVEWINFYKRFLSGVYSNDKRDWEILFDEHIKVTVNGEVLTDNITELYSKKADIIKLYGLPKYILKREYLKYKSEFKGMGYDKPYYIYNNCLGNNEYTYNFSVNRHNQVCELNINKVEDPATVICLNNTIDIGIKTPKIISANRLDFDKMQAACFEVAFDDGSNRIFYFDKVNADKSIEYASVVISYDDLQNISISSEDNSITIGGKVNIPSHIVFAKSLRQMYPEILDDILYEDEELIIKSIFREPLRKSWRFSSRYRGMDYEVFGPSNCFIDEYGYRKSKISYTDSEKGEGNIVAIMPENTDLYGIIKKDTYQWTEKPQFNHVYEFNGNCCNAKTEAGRVFINCNGKIVPGLELVDTDNYYDGLCPANIKIEKKSDYPNPHPFWDDRDFEYSPGLYGYIDTEGKMVVSPQYLYATGLYETDGHHAFVARFIDGKILWGVMDSSGKETVPCIYPQLSYAFEDGIVYYTDSGKCGLMDYNGKIITEPIFDRIPDYNAKTHMLNFENEEGLWGAYDCQQQKIVIQPLYSYVDVDDDWLEVEDTDDDNGIVYRCYDLEGNPIECPRNIPNYRDKKIVDLQILKENRWHEFNGLCDKEGNVIIPAKYSSISYHNGIIVASEKTDSNWRYRETLYKPDGTILLTGSYKEFSMNDKFIKVQTPEGLLTMSIIHKN